MAPRRTGLRLRARTPRLEKALLFSGPPQQSLESAKSHPGCPRPVLALGTAGHQGELARGGGALGHWPAEGVGLRGRDRRGGRASNPAACGSGRIRELTL